MRYVHKNLVDKIFSLFTVENLANLSLLQKLVLFWVLTIWARISSHFECEKESDGCAEAFINELKCDGSGCEPSRTLHHQPTSQTLIFIIFISNFYKNFSKRARKCLPGMAFTSSSSSTVMIDVEWVVIKFGAKYYIESFLTFHFQCNEQQMAWKIYSLEGIIMLLRRDLKCHPSISFSI